MSNKYYYLEDNTAKGPFSVEQLCKIKITPDTLVSTGGLDHWVKASTVPELNVAIRKNTTIRLFAGFLFAICVIVGVVKLILFLNSKDFSDLFNFLSEKSGISLVIESPEILMVKEGRLNGFPDKTINKGVNDFIGNPKWENGIAADGKIFVNVSGQISYMEKPVNMTLQFLISSNTFEVYALEFNNVPQSKIILYALLSKMFGGSNTGYNSNTDVSESLNFKTDQDIIEQKPASSSAQGITEPLTLSGKRLERVYVSDCEIEEDEGDLYESFVFENDHEFVYFSGDGPFRDEELTGANTFYHVSESYGGTYRMEGDSWILTATTKTETQYEIHFDNSEKIENRTEINESPAHAIRISKKNCGKNTFFIIFNEREFYFSIFN
jgi:hypothetical protein